MKNFAIDRIKKAPDLKKPNTVSVTIRVPDDILKALKAEARGIDMPYQSLWLLYTRKQLEAIGRLEEI